jgi:hypothetical protein
MAKPVSRGGGKGENSGRKTAGGLAENPARKQDAQGVQKDPAWFLTKGNVMTPVALFAKGTPGPAMLAERGYNKEPMHETLPTDEGVAGGGLSALKAFGLKTGKD